MTPSAGGATVARYAGRGVLLTVSDQDVDPAAVAAVRVVRARPSGARLRPVDEGYAEAHATWNLNARHRLALVVVAERPADVLDAVRFARDEGLGE
ncbi:MAG: hypothetical protein ACRD0A_02025 [Acidimicrobiales bacterium]